MFEWEPNQEWIKLGSIEIMVDKLNYTWARCSFCHAELEVENPRCKDESCHIARALARPKVRK